MNERNVVTDAASTDVLQAYRQAIDLTNKAASPEEKIMAYSRVIELGKKYTNQNKEELLKYNMIMYWSYNHLADAWFNKSFKEAVEPDTPAREAFEKSLKYYQQGLTFAQDNLEKISILNRMADSYKQLGDEPNLCEVKKKVLANLNDEDKRRAYQSFADSLKNKQCAALMYEEALNHINDEKVNLAVKFQNTITICDKLLIIYEQEDKTNYQRIAKLKDNSFNLMTTCQKKGGCSF